MTQIIEATQIVNNNIKTYVAIVLDMSGSMADCRKPTILGFNEQVQTIKNNADNGKYFVSLVKFNNKVDKQFFNESVENLVELNDNSYHPNGGTAMYDAVGQTIDWLNETTDINDPNNAYLVIIISDGMENASEKYKSSDVAEKIQSMMNTGRATITYMGANQDLSIVNKNLHIPLSNMACYTSDDTGTSHAMNKMSGHTKKYMTCRAKGAAPSANFFNKDEEISDLTTPKPKK